MVKLSDLKVGDRFTVDGVVIYRMSHAATTEFYTVDDDDGDLK